MQIGLRGGWPGRGRCSPGRPRSGIRHLTTEGTCAGEGIDEIVEGRDRDVGAGPVYLTIDVDVLDPAFAGPDRDAPRRAACSPAS